MNRSLEQRFAAAAAELRALGYPARVDLAYHGTDAGTSYKIAAGGFIAPRSSAGQNLGHRSGNSGFYGDGIYLSPSPNVAQGYAGGRRLLVCNVLRGTPYRCPGLMMGAELQKGYSSHESPDGREWVLFNAAQVLPVAVIHFGDQRVSYPKVLAPLQFNDGGAGPDLADDEFALARQQQRYHTARQRAFYGYDGRTTAQRRALVAAAAVKNAPAPHVSNRDRKMLNRAEKRGQQRQRR